MVKKATENINSSGKYKPYREAKKLNVRFQGKPLVSEKYKVTNKLGDIAKFVQAKSIALKEKGFDGRMSVAVFYPNHGWRSGHLTSVGDEVHFFSPDGYDEDDDMSEFEDDAGKTKHFNLYYVMNGKKKGGKSKDSHNDCLFYCLKAAMHDDVPWKFASNMKKWLELDRDEPIDIAFMQKIEARCKTYKINVSGDYTYTSTKNNNLEIKIALLNGHYSLIPNTTVVNKGISFTEKVPLIYTNINNNTAVSVCDGITEWVINKKQFREIHTKPKSNPYILIPADTSKIKGVLKYADKFEEHKAFVVKADILKEKTNGLVNMYKTGKDKRAALALFSHFQKAAYPDHIDQNEAEWINKASSGALSSATKYTGPGYKYDVVSQYPSIMADPHTLFPFKKGTFHIVTTTEVMEMTLIPYGIYKCQVQIDQNAFKEFRYNTNNYYTHLDLIVAKKLGLTITMCDNGQANQLMYVRSTDMLTGKQLFGKFVNLLFPLKKQGIKEVKGPLNCLWGALCEANTHTIEATDSTDENAFQDIEDNNSLQTIVPVNDDIIRVTFCKNNDMFSTSYARIKPFMLAYGRRMTQSYISGIDSIVHVHTDGFISTKKLDIVTGTELGDLKYEGYCPDVTIVNINKVVGKFE